MLAWAKLYQFEFDEVCPNLTPAQMVVYMSLVSCRNSKTNQTHPVGVDLLTAKTGLKRRTVFDALKVLAEKGYISKTKAGRKSCYAFPIVDEKCIQPHSKSAYSRTQNRNIEQ